jgi:transketolase N-terminal domain/subunit
LPRTYSSYGTRLPGSGHRADRPHDFYVRQGCLGLQLTLGFGIKLGFRLGVNVGLGVEFGLGVFLGGGFF